MKELEVIVQELAARGYKLTRQRLAIIRELDCSKGPLTAEEIFLGIRADKSPASLATVYRNLKILSDGGLIEKADLLDDKIRYVLRGKPHTHNLICLSCHKVAPLSSCPLNALTETIGKKEGFMVTEHKMELYGYCLECAEKAIGSDH